MKKLIPFLLFVFSLTAYSNLIDQQTCARRYIEGSKELVEIANEYNHGSLNTAEYATKVGAIDSTILGIRMICGLKENRSAKECVDATKPVFQKIRNKMYVAEVVKGNISRVEVSELDLIGLTKGGLKGLWKKISRGEDENLCKI